MYGQLTNLQSMSGDSQEWFNYICNDPNYKTQFSAWCGMGFGGMKQNVQLVNLQSMSGDSQEWFNYICDDPNYKTQFAAWCGMGFGGMRL